MLNNEIDFVTIIKTVTPHVDITVLRFTQFDNIQGLTTFLVRKGN